jgi:hypothetical protein
MSEAFLIGLACLLSYIVGVFQTKYSIRNEEANKQYDSIQRANAARESVVDGDESAISADIYNRDNRK